ncbi:MAG: 4-alpha-glucanotransferase [Clostridiales bacterium]|nr:4-alpha-glucanotransferase [Clostridiales bacterium]
MNNQESRRSAGVLMPLTMLPGPFGIGVLGAEARDFVDFLCEGGFSSWQMLPVEHLSVSFSPYKCVSAFAGDPMFIDPRWLLEQGWVTEAELDARCGGMDAYSVQYELVFDKQMILLRSAFARLPGRIAEEYNAFNPFWLEDYALYMAIREQYNMQPWYAWPNEALRRYEPEALERARQENRSMMAFYRFVQWAFDAQWRELKQYAARKGVALIGDIPFYVSDDSAEVWSRREMFDTDENGMFRAVAGAPPDYFTPEGQCWGNPLYNWEYMEKEGYRWWIERMRAALSRFDSVRIDHFRGFESFWYIPADCLSAKEGKWVKGPGAKPFQAMARELGAMQVIAEDLGVIGPEVETLLEETGFPGMRVLQFGFLGDKRHLPHRYEENKVAYTGTHDNTTLLAWMYELQDEDRDKALFYSGYEGDWRIGGPNCGVCRAWIRLLYLSKARMVIMPIQDLLGFGGDTRTNVPGNPEGNWRFRITREALAQIDLAYYRHLAALTERDAS